MNELASFLAGLLGASPIEIIASLSGFLCVYLLIRRNMWCWPVGLVQVSLYLIIFVEVKLYSDAILHAIYIALQLYGWHYWQRNRQQTGTIEVLNSSAQELVLWVGVALISTVALGYIMLRYTDAALPYADAFTTCASLVAQWLLSRRKLINWFFWIAVDVVAINVYLTKNLYPTALLYALFLILATIGLGQWMLTARRQRAVAMETS